MKDIYLQILEVEAILSSYVRTPTILLHLPMISLKAG